MHIEHGGWTIDITSPESTQPMFAVRRLLVDIAVPPFTVSLASPIPDILPRVVDLNITTEPEPPAPAEIGEF
jgi:hypothetical protein